MAKKESKHATPLFVFFLFYQLQSILFGIVGLIVLSNILDDFSIDLGGVI